MLGPFEGTGVTVAEASRAGDVDLRDWGTEASDAEGVAEPGA